MDFLAFRKAGPPGKPHPLYVVTGSDDFLKRQALLTLRDWFLGPDGSDFGLSTYVGDAVTFATVRDELDMVPFIGTRRLVVIDQAAPFVTAYRAYLENYLAKPPATGVLVLEVATWPGNTRLAKLLPDAATLVCEAPTGAALAAWCVAQAKQAHDATLAKPAAQLLVELVGAELGLLDQELAKLAAFAGPGATIDATAVDQMVGRNREANTFGIFHAIASGRAADALIILDELFTQGEDARRTAGALAWQLKPVAQVARLVQLGWSVGEALGQVDARARRSVEPLLRWLGLGRASQLFDQLLELDRSLKLQGAGELSERALMERFITRLARPREGTAGQPNSPGRPTRS